MQLIHSLFCLRFIVRRTYSSLMERETRQSPMPVRYRMAFLSSLGFLISFAIRCNMGVSIVAMNVDQTEISPNGTIKTIRVRRTRCGGRGSEQGIRLARPIPLDTEDDRIHREFILLGLSSHPDPGRISRREISRQSVSITLLKQGSQLSFSFSLSVQGLWLCSGHHIPAEPVSPIGCESSSLLRDLHSHSSRARRSNSRQRGGEREREEGPACSLGCHLSSCSWHLALVGSTP